MKKILLILILFPTVIFAMLNPSNTYDLVPKKLKYNKPIVLTPLNGNKLDVDFKTGADNLEMKPFQQGVEIRIIILNRADVILLNANNNQNWPNNSIKRDCCIKDTLFSRTHLQMEQV